MNSHQAGSVTPHAGVWIETGVFSTSGTMDSRSLPTRECGLKHVFTEKLEAFCVSLPTRECGLKLPAACGPDARARVTPHAGVWIETHIRTMLQTVSMSLPTRECGLKPLPVGLGGRALASLPTRECMYSGRYPFSVPVIPVHF